MERIERTPTPFPVSTVHPALRESPEPEPHPDGSVTTSYETAPESSKLVATLEKKIFEGSADTFAKLNDSQSTAPVDHLDSTGNLTPVSKEDLSVHDDASPGTTIHRMSEDYQDHSTLNDHQQKWDHVSVNETNS